LEIKTSGEPLKPCRAPPEDEDCDPERKGLARGVFKERPAAAVVPPVVVVVLCFTSNYTFLPFYYF